MTGREIAANLRANVEKWSRYYYFRDGHYCVVGLKLHEAGIPDEELEGFKANYVTGLHVGLTPAQEGDLNMLQRMNDESKSVYELIAKLEDQRANHNFPIEALAAALKQ